MDADTAAAKSEIADLSDTETVVVEADTAELKRAGTEVSRFVTSVEKVDPTVGVDADTAAARTEVTGFIGLLRAIPKKFTVTADADTGAARLSLLGLKAAAVGSGGVLQAFNTVGFAVSNLGKVVIPAAVVAGVSALAPLMATGAIGGAGIMAVVAGFGLIALAARDTFKEIKFENGKFVAAEGATLRGSQKRLIDSLNAAAKAYDRAMTPAYRAFDKLAIKVSRGAHPAFRPIGDAARASVNAVTAAFGNIQRKIKVPRQLRSFKTILEAIPGIVNDLTNAAGSFVLGIVNIVAESMPQVKDFTGWLEDAAEQFRKWTLNSDNQKKIRDWLKDGADFAKDLAKEAGKFITGLWDFSRSQEGQDMVDGLITLFGAIAKAGPVLTKASKFFKDANDFLSAGGKKGEGSPIQFEKNPFPTSFSDFLGFDTKNFGKDTGKDVGEGFIEGVLEVLTSRESIIGQFRDWWEAIKKWWGVKSPSTKAKNELGKPIMQGVLEGLKSVPIVGGLVRIFQKLFGDGKQKVNNQKWGTIGSSAAGKIAAGFARGGIIGGALAIIGSWFTKSKNKRDGQKWQPLGSSAAEAVSRGFKNGGLLGAAVALIGSWFSKSQGEKNKKKWNPLGSSASEAIAKGWKNGGLIGAAVSLVSSWFSKSQGEKNKKKWQPLGGSAASAIARGWKNGGLLGAAVSLISSWFGKAQGEKNSKKWSPVGGDAARKIAQGWKNGGLLGAAVSLIASWFGKAQGEKNKKKWGPIGGSAAGSIASGWKNGGLLGAAVSLVASWFNKTDNEVGSKGWYGIGRSTVEGIGRGITNTSPTLKNALTKLAGLLPGWVKNALGIASPSKVFRDEIGRNIGESWALGIEDKMGRVRGAAERMAREAASAAQDAYAPDLSASVAGLSVRGFSGAHYAQGLRQHRTTNVSNSMGVTVNVYAGAGQSAEDIGVAVGRELKRLQRQAKGSGAYLSGSEVM